MASLKITKPAVDLLRTMIVSCGNINCFEAMKVLDSVQGTVDFDSIAKVPEYSYRLKAFERLEKYAKDNNISTLSLFDVAKYFSGDYHISIMDEFAAHAGLAKYLGEAFGLVSHVLLPLEGNVYQNGNHTVRIEGAYSINPRDKGIPCFHLGLIVNIPITAEQKCEILQIQQQNRTFQSYLSELPEIVEIPAEYYEALNCVANRI